MSTSKNKILRRIALVVGSIVVTLTVAVFIFGAMNTMTPNFRSQTGLYVYAAYPLNDRRIKIGDSLEMNVDFGQTISLITKDDIEKIKRLGLPIDSGIFPMIGINHLDEYFITAKTYIVSFPVYNERIIGDTIAPGGDCINYIDGIVFSSAPDIDIHSTLGTDFLERFVVEYRPSQKAICLRQRVPDTGFEKLTDMKQTVTLSSILGCGHRYYVPLTVEYQDNDYFMDTSFKRAQLKLPERDTTRALGTPVDTFVYTLRRTIPARVQHNVWSNIGNRAGLHDIYYCNSDKEPYSISPFNYFKQDVIFDFPNKRMYIRAGAL